MSVRKTEAGLGQVKECFYGGRWEVKGKFLDGKAVQMFCVVDRSKQVPDPERKDCIAAEITTFPCFVLSISAVLGSQRYASLDLGLLHLF